MPAPVILRLGALAVAAGMLGASAALAQTCTATSTGVAFGGYSTTLLSPTDGSGSVSVRCTALLALTVSYTVDLAAGSSGSFSPRTMRQGASALGYNLYTSAARTTVWGNGTGGTGRISATGILVTPLTPHNATYTVFGRIPARQNIPIGPYIDTIMATVTY